MKLIQLNTPLFNYFLTLKEGIYCTLTQAKLMQNNVLRVEGRTLTSSALKAAAIVPVVGRILSAGGKGLEWLNEEEIKYKLRKYEQMFQHEHISAICYLIAAKLTID